MSARFFLPALLGTIALAASVEGRLGDAIAGYRSQRLVLRAGITATYSPQRPRRALRFLDRIDGILSCQLGLLLNFGARKVELKRKVEELRERPVYPVILSKRALLPSHTSSYL